MLQGPLLYTQSKERQACEGKPSKSTQPLKGGTAKGAYRTLRTQPSKYSCKQASPRLGNQAEQKLAQQADAQPTAVGPKSESSPLPMTPSELASPEASNKDTLSQVESDLEINPALMLLSGQTIAHLCRLCTRCKMTQTMATMWWLMLYRARGTLSSLPAYCKK